MTIKIGIIGAGGMAKVHISGFRAAGGEVVAIADVNANAAANCAAQHNVARHYGSAAEMLSVEKLDAVSIITPNKFHKPLTLQALAAGKHVYCEKPPALTAVEAQAMAAAAGKARRTLMFDFNNRARPESYAMMDYLRNGAVGRINSAQALWIRRTGIPGFGGWFTNKALSGGGPLIDLLHMLDLALYFMDYPQPEWVLAQTFTDFIGDHSFKGPWGVPERRQRRYRCRIRRPWFCAFQDRAGAFPARLLGRDEPPRGSQRHLSGRQSRRRGPPSLRLRRLG